MVDTSNITADPPSFMFNAANCSECRKDKVSIVHVEFKVSANPELWNTDSYYIVGIDVLVYSINFPSETNYDATISSFLVFSTNFDESTDGWHSWTKSPNVLNTIQVSSFQVLQEKNPDPGATYSTSAGAAYLQDSLELALGADSKWYFKEKNYS